MIRGAVSDYERARASRARSRSFPFGYAQGQNDNQKGKGKNACRSLHFAALRSRGQGVRLRFGREDRVWVGLAGEVELGDFEIAGLGHFEVAGVALDYEDGDVGALEEAGFVGAGELVGCGFGEGAAE
jgi:hypothetical protein